ncbi:hypothetical protein BCR41DRAFT_368842 [Lobosporangium transversale]|uniref:Uncharacterized protein n=1 Tax=Lobosporangium transversale TaxID=64571 RepID=A0A1Y2GTV8_9FUNG|nr:hypothetical protein BCR41DRAFT_368842 [Lobosporangium transversale]ORZ23687.1 hypothetical protein BCR41DRAFT_368842 [Lobosporangium transversale]|eukprot:XP_021883501.1 hypothetical protein BCR41DRAFT_368842 [Lobosporangium transversale]
MIPYFIPPQPQSTLGQQASREVGNVDPALDASLMTPPMSPTESSFGFHSNSTIEGRFASPSSQHSYLSSPNDWRSFKTDSVVSPTKGSMSSPVSLGSGSGSTLGSTGLSPRAVSFNWDRYEDFHEDQDDRDSQDESDNDHEGNSMTAKTPYYKQFEGHHSIVRRRSSYGGEDEGHYRHELGQPTEEPYDSLRHGIGLSLSDMNEELEKARAQMSRASRAMRNMEHELQVMQQSIDESKASNASARSAIEENFWRLECLARTIEKDRQESQKRIQAVGRDCNEAIETVTNWEVRIDWLEKRVDNTSEYVSELVLSEQECRELDTATQDPAPGCGTDEAPDGEASWTESVTFTCAFVVTIPV